MVKGQGIQVSSRMPKVIVDFMDEDIKRDAFISRADWVQCACREFMKIRIAELNSRDAHGGGGSR